MQKSELINNKRRWVIERWPRKRKFGCLNSSLDRSKSLNTGSDSSPSKSSAIGVSDNGPRT